MRLATTLLLLGALFGVVPTAVAHAAPSDRPVSYAAFGRSGGSGSHGSHSGFGGGASRGGSSRGRTSSGWHRHTGTNGSSRHGMKPWEVILVLIVFVGFFGYLGHLGVKKVRRLLG
ncbi:hypothetical protein ACFVT2_32990 [Streptomyces sp. NPDC058000]|uniref:hypothetical protein n=1 Tax=Streptomyces sp. NPDC058000 TaxID=3346299 RepID=UPI0036E8D842